MVLDQLAHRCLVGCPRIAPVYRPGRLRNLRPGSVTASWPLGTSRLTTAGAGADFGTLSSAGTAGWVRAGASPSGATGTEGMAWLAAAAAKKAAA